MRLNSSVSESLLDEINEEYGDILLRDRFEQFAGPLEGEDDVYPDKHRLVFAFDRRSAGRLRLLIDKLNEDSAA